MPVVYILWFSCGLQMGLTVPFMKPKQLGKALPFILIASAYVWSKGRLIKVWFHAFKRWWCRLYTISITWLVIMQISGTGRPNRCIRSLYLQGYANLLKRRQKPSIPSHTVPCSHIWVRQPHCLCEKWYVPFSKTKFCQTLTFVEFFQVKMLVILVGKIDTIG